MMPPKLSYREHENMVKEFMLQKKLEDEDTYDAVCKRYPVQSYQQYKRSKGREITVGLLGLAPSRISPVVAEKNDIESSLIGGTQE